MDDALNAAGTFLDAVLVWLRVTNTAGLPTVSHGEAIYSPLIAAAFLFRVFAVLDMVRLLRRLKRDGLSEELGASARERLQRSQRGMLRIGIFGLICWALLTNYEYTTIVFTFGLLGYAVLENIDGALGWKYQLDRRRYWRERDALEDYAERALAETREASEQASAAAKRAEAAVVAATTQGERLETILATALAAIRENTAMTQAGVAHAEAAYHEANDVNAKIAAIGEDQRAQADRTERLVQENVALTRRAGERAGDAAGRSEAAHRQAEALSTELAEHRRQDQADVVDHIRETTDATKIIADETHAIVSNTRDGAKEPPE